MNENGVISFLKHNIANRIGVPKSLVLDNVSYLSSLKLIEYALEKGIKFKYFAIYYPKGNGVVESSNKSLVIIILKKAIENQRNWHNTLSNFLCAY